MKPIITILISSLLLSSSYSFGQVFGESGSKWMLDVVRFDGPEIWEVNYTKDITEQGKPCKVFETTRHEFLWNGMAGYAKYIKSSKLDEHIIHVSGDTVFNYRNGNFYVLYNFSALKGNSWDLGYDENQFGDSCGKSFAHVYEVGDTTINGNKYRYLKTHPDTLTASYWLSGTIIEKIGMVGYPFPLISDWCTNIVAELPTVNLRCFSSDSFPTYETGINNSGLWLNQCDVNFWSSIEEFGEQNQANIYPNPTAGEVFIQMNNLVSDYEIEVYNAQGQLLSREIGNQDTEEIFIDGEKGYYQLVIKSETGTASFAVIKD